MSPAIYVQVNLVSALVCILLYYEQKKYHAFGFLGTSTFNALLWFTVVILVTDSFSWLMVADAFPHSAGLLMFSRCVYYFVQALLPMLFMDYIIKACGYHTPFALKVLRALPIPFTVVVLILNFNRHFAFRVENNSFSRGEGFLYAILAPVIYIILILFFSLIAYLRAQPDRKKFARNLFISVLITFFGSALSAVVPGTAPWHIFVFALLYLYMSFHGNQERSLDYLAFSDTLTGLKNYAAYNLHKQRLNKKLAQDPHHHFAVAVMDINYLKQVNDTYGHTAGNELICSSGKLICNVFAHSPVFRVGGDEFLAILENSDYVNREKLQSQFEALSELTTFPAGELNLPVSVALGIAAYDPKRHRSFDDVMQDADQTMYDNKALFKQKK